MMAHMEDNNDPREKILVSVRIRRELDQALEIEAAETQVPKSSLVEAALENAFPTSLRKARKIAKERGIV